MAALLAAGLAALAGGGYWYLRNLAHTGSPLPWFDLLGPISLPAPDQALGGREAHSVLGYLTDGSIWSDWFLPGLHHGFGFLWPLLGGLAIPPGSLLNLGRRFSRPPSSFAPSLRSPGWPRCSPGSWRRPRRPAPRGHHTALSRGCATWPAPLALRGGDAVPRPALARLDRLRALPD